MRFGQVVIVALVAAVGQVAAAPAHLGGVKLKIAGVAPAKSLRQLAVVDADSGEVLGADGVEKKRRLILRPEPNVLFASITDVSARSARSGVSRVFLVDPNVASTAKVKTRKLDLDAAAARVSAKGLVRPAATGGTIATMSSIGISTSGTSQTTSIGAGLLSGVFNQTHDAGVRWVDTSQRFIDARNTELRLQADGKLDPSTPIRDELIPPNTRIEGEMTDADGHLTGEIRIVDLSTGEVIARIPVDRPYDKKDLDDLRKLIGDLADELIRNILERLGTTTTSSSTTTSTSSTTITTTSTLAPTTTTSTSTSTTTVPTTTSTSSTTSSTVIPCGAGLVESVEVLREIHASAFSTATDPLPLPHSASESFSVAMGTESAGSSGTNTYSWDLTATTHSTAKSSGAITWMVAPCEITASGTMHEESFSGSEDSSASTDLEARIQLKIKVKSLAPFTLTGQLRATGDAHETPPPTSFFTCSGSFDTASADLVAPTGIAVPFGETSTLHPDDEYLVSCAVERGDGSFPDGDDADLEWSWTMTFGN